MSETPRRFKLVLKGATDLFVPPDLEVGASGVVEFRGVGFVADVERVANRRGREVGYLKVEAIEIRQLPDVAEDRGLADTFPNARGKAAP